MIYRCLIPDSTPAVYEHHPRQHVTNSRFIQTRLYKASINRLRAVRLIFLIEQASPLCMWQFSNFHHQGCLHRFLHYFCGREQRFTPVNFNLFKFLPGNDNSVLTPGISPLFRRHAVFISKIQVSRHHVNICESMRVKT